MGLRLMDTKKRIIILVCLVIIFILFLTTIILSFKKKDTPVNDGVAIVLNEGNLVINYLDGQDIYLDKLNRVYNVSVTNNDINKLFYSIELNDFKSDSDAVVELLDEDGNVISTKRTFSKNNTLIYLETIDPGSTKRYKVNINNVVNNKLTAKLNVVNESNTDETFANLILLNNDVREPSSKVGIDISTSNEGLIASKDNDGLSYYFRGNVDNNYVLLNDMLFRIVRINGDSSVRLVLDDTIGNYVYNNKELELGNGFDSLVSLSNSSLYNELLDWYNNNLLEYDSIIQESSFCIEKEFNNMINNLNYTSTYDRIMIQKSPSLVCSNSVEKLKIGLLSIDEVMLAGASDKENNKYYLYNSNIKDNYVTSSTYYISLDSNIVMLNVMSNGSIGSGVNIKDNTSIRPVININNSVKIKGNGTKNNPYIIVS